MYYDLNVPIGASSKTCDKRVIQELVRYGYGCIAVNYECGTAEKPLEASSIDLLNLEELSTISNKNSSEGLKQKDQIGIQLLKRITLRLDNIASAQLLISSRQFLKGYDLVAAIPENEDTFKFLCEQGNVDIISFDISFRIDFPLKKSLIKMAIERSVKFEITYSQALGTAGGRNYFFGNAYSIIQSTDGKNLILSSNAKDRISIRSPYDVINMGCLLGMPYGKAFDTIQSTCESIVRVARNRTE